VAVTLSKHFGLVPRNHARLLVLASGLMLLALLVITMAGFALFGAFGRHSPREFYYLSLLGLIVVGLVLAPRPALATVALALCAVDLGLGVGSELLVRAGVLEVSVMPPPYYVGGGYRWHPLLQAVPIPSLDGGIGSLRIAHSSAGTRGREHSASELASKRVVAVFGGSTTYDLAVTDGTTWPDRLEAATNRHRSRSTFWKVSNGLLDRVRLSDPRLQQIATEIARLPLPINGNCWRAGSRL
jgi:hypothetical protein